MAYISPQGTKCINRPWGKTECECEYDYWGNATCHNKKDISQSSYTQIVQNATRSDNHIQSKDNVITLTFTFLKRLVFVCG